MEKRKFKCGNCDHVFSSTTETAFSDAKPGEYWHTMQGYVGKCPECAAYAKEIMCEDDKQEVVDEQTMDKIKETFAAFFDNSKKMFLCPNCVHKDVCRKIDDSSRQCEDFMDASEPEKYSSIYHFFQPIFYWIKFHYPSGGVKFVVDHNSAQMYIEHGPKAFSKEITDFSFADYTQQKTQTAHSKKQG